MTEPLLKKALSYEKTFINDDEMYIKYQLREDALRDENTKISLAEKRGIKQGIKQEKIQTVINFLKLGVNIETISKGTGLSPEQIHEIQKTSL